MLVNEAGDVVDLAVDDHPQIISVLVLGDLLEGEDLLLGSISRNGGGVRHCVSIAGWECRGAGGVAGGGMYGLQKHQKTQPNSRLHSFRTVRAYLCLSELSQSLFFHSTDNLHVVLIHHVKDDDSFIETLFGSEASVQWPSSALQPGWVRPSRFQYALLMIESNVKLCKNHSELGKASLVYSI
jgi:hypothetical protein